MNLVRMAKFPKVAVAEVMRQSKLADAINDFFNLEKNLIYPAVFSNKIDINK